MNAIAGWGSGSVAFDARSARSIPIHAGRPLIRGGLDLRPPTHASPHYGRAGAGAPERVSETDPAALFAGEAYDQLDLAFDPREKAVWCHMKPHGAPSFTPTLLRELIAVRRSVQRMFAAAPPGADAPVRYFVGGSRLPRIYNLGGDLAHFARCIRTGDREALRRYAHDCIDVAYHMYAGFDSRVITIALVQGDALGGGFEGAMSFNVMVAEKSAKFGLPEILFNLFPGMGAYSFLSRRLDGARAERMILSGKVFGAQEMYDMGLVDVLAEDGKGEDAVRDYIAKNRRRHDVHCSLAQVRRRVDRLTYEELRDVTDIWVDTAMRLEEADLRKMERLTSAQNRRLAGEAAAEA